MCLHLSDTGISELFSAYAKAQADMGEVLKVATNPAFKSRYADLAAVVEAVMPALSKHGLALIQAPAFDGETVSVETMITHTAGGFMRSTINLRPTKADPQGVGSAITYARRYALMAMAGVAPEDDDGNGASQPGNGGQRFNTGSTQNAPPKITPDQVGELQELIESVSANKVGFLQYMKVASLADIPAARFDAAISALKAKRAA